MYEFLEAEGYRYAIRLPANAVLYRQIQDMMTRPVGRPPEQPIVKYRDFQYQAATWGTAAAGADNTAVMSLMSSIFLTSADATAKRAWLCLLCG